MNLRRSVLVSVCLCAAAWTSAQAELFDRGGGFIYDDVLNITWTQNANINGPDNWDNQVTWAESLSLFDSVRGVTWDDWRLPNVDVNGDGTLIACPFATEPECRDNEYGYMFRENGITAAMPGLFSNVQAGIYWSGTEHFPNPLSFAQTYHFGLGAIGNHFKTSNFYAWAVRDGDVVAQPLIEPITGFLGAAADSKLEFFQGQPPESFSLTAASDFTTSQLDFGVTKSAGSALIDIAYLMDVGLEGFQSEFQVVIQIDLREEATYEFFGGMSASSDGFSGNLRQAVNAIKFRNLDPIGTIYQEVENTIYTSPVDFTINDLNEGTEGGNTPSLGLRTGLLSPGRYELDVVSFIATETGVSATGISDISLRLSTTASAPGTLLEQLGADVAGVGPGNSLADKVVLAQTYLAVPDIQTTCAVLTGFINQVRAQRGKKLTLEKADQLTGDALIIMDAIRCD